MDVVWYVNIDNAHSRHNNATQAQTRANFERMVRAALRAAPAQPAGEPAWSVHVGFNAPAQPDFFNAWARLLANVSSALQCDARICGGRRTRRVVLYLEDDWRLEEGSAPETRLGGAMHNHFRRERLLAPPNRCFAYTHLIGALDRTNRSLAALRIDLQRRPLPYKFSPSLWSPDLFVAVYGESLRWMRARRLHRDPEGLVREWIDGTRPRLGNCSRDPVDKRLLPLFYDAGRTWRRAAGLRKWNQFKNYAVFYREQQ
jgi:hypothetical protein